MIKKIIAIICCAVFVLCLVGCTNAEDKNNETQMTRVDAGTCVYTYVDKETGVNYLIYDGAYSGGIFPRYNADGSLYVRGEQE